MGQCDLVALFDAPNGEAAAKVMLGIGQRGTVSSQTMRLFSEAEYRRLCAELP